MERLLVLLLRILSSIPFFSLSGVKSRIYRILGAEIGEHVHFAPHSFVIVDDFKKLKIGDGVSFGYGVVIDCEELEVGDDTVFSWGINLSGSMLKVGRGCYLAPKVYIDLNEPVIIEDEVGVVADYILTHAVWHPVTEGGLRKFASVRIKRGAWIGAGAFIMPGVTVGENATVGARSLVIDDVPDGCVVAGIPAKVIKTAEEARGELTFKEKDKIVIDIINEYTTKLKEKGIAVSGQQFVDPPFMITEMKSRLRKMLLTYEKRWCVVYTNQVLRTPHLDSLTNLCKNFDLILFISLVPIPRDLMKSLNKNIFSNVIWFSISDRIRKKSWEEEAISLHHFFRSRYGIRFKLYKEEDAGS